MIVANMQGMVFAMKSGLGVEDARQTGTGLTAQGDTIAIILGCCECDNHPV
jgi:hypothetical protein